MRFRGFRVYGLPNHTGEIHTIESHQPPEGAIFRGEFERRVDAEAAARYYETGFLLVGLVFGLGEHEWKVTEYQPAVGNSEGDLLIIERQEGGVIVANTTERPTFERWLHHERERREMELVMMINLQQPVTADELISFALLLNLRGASSLDELRAR